MCGARAGARESCWGARARVRTGCRTRAGGVRAGVYRVEASTDAERPSGDGGATHPQPRVEETDVVVGWRASVVVVGAASGWSAAVSIFCARLLLLNTNP